MRIISLWLNCPATSQLSGGGSRADCSAIVRRDLQQANGLTIKLSIRYKARYFTCTTLGAVKTLSIEVSATDASAALN